MSAAATRDALREVARDVLTTRPKHGDPAALSRTMAQLDWYALLVDPGLGGVGAPLGAALTVVEELAAADAPGHYVHDGVLAPVALAQLPAVPPTRDLTNGLATGSRHVCVLPDAALDERFVPEIGTAPSGLVISGRSGPVEPADDMDTLLVLVRDGVTHHLVVLPVGTPGLTVESATDPTGRPVQRVVLASVPLAGHIRAAISDSQIEQLVTVAALAATARMVGAAARSLDITLRHVRIRAQFGRPLAAFQAVQMRCADLARDVDSSRCMQGRAVEAFEAGRPDRHVLTSMAKSWANEACTRATQTAHLLHGAIGFTAEYELHRHSATVLTSRLGAGSTRFHRARVARHLITSTPDRSVP